VNTLIAYAGKYGCTESCATVLAEVLHQEPKYVEKQKSGLFSQRAM
jgi:menaquinone-dependent protoporphyrinogen IX oxidase